jgi:hypothetical protein
MALLGRVVPARWVGLAHSVSAGQFGEALEDRDE